MRDRVTKTWSDSFPLRTIAMWENVLGLTQAQQSSAPGRNHPWKGGARGEAEPGGAVRHTRYEGSSYDALVVNEPGNPGLEVGRAVVTRIRYFSATGVSTGVCGVYAHWQSDNPAKVPLS